MSGGAPVFQYGRSSEFGGVLDFIQSMISNDILRHTFNIPHLVVVGRQNMAKTTLINRLIGRYILPMRREDTTDALQARTKFPIILNLRHGEKKMVEVSCNQDSVQGGKEENPEDHAVENFLKGLEEKLPKEEGTPISKVHVNVTLEGPEFTTLTLVDLPGVHFANDQPRMNQVTQELVLEYIQKNTNSIIVIVSEVGDPTGDSAINLVMEKAPEYKSRTICALTKPDRLNENDDMGKKVAMNESDFTLDDNRFILLRGKDSKDPKEKGWDAEMTRVKEREWFARHPQYKDIQHVCGIDRLMYTMISLLAEKMRTQLPILVTQMKEQKRQADKEIEKLKEIEVPESMEKKGELIMKLKQNLITELEKRLTNNTSHEEGGEVMRKLFRSFQQEAFQMNPLAGRNDGQIRKELDKLIGAVTPLGESSENNQLLQKLLYEKYTEHSSSGQSVKIPSPIDQLLSISEKLVTGVDKTLQDIVYAVVDEKLIQFPKLKEIVKVRVVRKTFREKCELTKDFIRQFLEMQKQNVDEVSAPIPLPSEIREWELFPMSNGLANPCMESKTMKRLKYLAKKVYPKELISGIQNPLGAHAQSFTYKEQEEITTIKRNVVRCFNVIKMNVCDTVPRCVLHFFVKQLLGDLRRALEGEESLVEYLVEKKESLARRNLRKKQSLALKERLPHAELLEEKLLRMNSQG